MDEDKARKNVVVADFKKIHSWRRFLGDNSRTLWLKEGGKCTRFFHRATNSHRRFNAIKVLHSEGNVLLDRSVRNILHSFLIILLWSNTLGDLSLKGWLSTRLTSHADWLERMLFLLLLL